MLAILTAATLHAAAPASIPEPPKAGMPAICLAIAPRLVESVGDGVLTRKQAAAVFKQCLQDFNGQGVQY
jgi:hypothetical protein